MDQSASPVSEKFPSSGPLSSERLLRLIIPRVAHDFGVQPQALLVRTRGTPQAAFARQVAVYLAHVCFGLSFAAVGRLFQRDRTTVAHACRVIEDRRDDDGLDRRLTALERACRRSFITATSREADAGFLEFCRHSRPAIKLER
jgi:hypothetical protein